MDIGRRKDLEQLDAVLSDMSKPYGVRQHAYRAKQAIIKQLQDKGLQELRNRLMKAAAANDEVEEWKISNQIKDYLHEKKLEKPV